MAMFIGCATTDQIAAKVGITRESVNVVIRRVMARRRAERDQMGDYALDQMVAQVDSIMAGHFIKAAKGDARSAEVCLKLMERRAKLLGLDQPMQAEVRVTKRSEIDAEIENLLGKLRHTPEAPVDVEAP